MSSQSENVTKSVSLLGRVKWFNNKAGFGFITVTDGPQSGTDIFVHHSSINVGSSAQYKYLVQGEYVEFTTVDTPEGSKHKVQAGTVTGVKGGKLMYETRMEIRTSVRNYKQTQDGQPTTASAPVSTQPKQRGPPRQQRAPQKGSDDTTWTKVKKGTKV